MPIAYLTGNSQTGESSKTFIFENEGHTLGNALRYIISSYENVDFCGYTVPHPSEAKMHFRIQMKHGLAVDALRRGLEDLVQVCDHTLNVFNTELIQFNTQNKLTMDSS